MVGGSHLLMGPWGLKHQPYWRALTSFLSTTGISFKLLIELIERKEAVICSLLIPGNHISGAAIRLTNAAITRINNPATQLALHLTTSFVIALWTLGKLYAGSSACHGRVNVNGEGVGALWLSLSLSNSLALLRLAVCSQVTFMGLFLEKSVCLLGVLPYNSIGNNCDI